MRADDLLAQVLPEVLERSRVNPEEVDDFLVGAAVGVNENWSYGGRYPSRPNSWINSAVPPWPVSKLVLWKSPPALQIR
jgi:hypothetical protein